MIDFIEFREDKRYSSKDVVEKLNELVLELNKAILDNMRFYSQEPKYLFDGLKKIEKQAFELNKFRNDK